MCVRVRADVCLCVHVYVCVVCAFVCSHELTLNAFPPLVIICSFSCLHFIAESILILKTREVEYVFLMEDPEERARWLKITSTKK